jgi:hypothetical protein
VLAGLRRRGDERRAILSQFEVQVTLWKRDHATDSWSIGTLTSAMSGRSSMKRRTYHGPSVSRWRSRSRYRTQLHTVHRDDSSTRARRSCACDGWIGTSYRWPSTRDAVLQSELRNAPLKVPPQLAMVCQKPLRVIGYCLPRRRRLTGTGTVKAPLILRCAVDDTATEIRQAA